MCPVILMDVELLAHLDDGSCPDRALLKSEPRDQRIVCDDVDGARISTRPIVDDLDRVAREALCRDTAGCPDT
jgi:hypothetical protein